MAILSALAAVVLAAPAIHRDEFGVPHVKASSFQDAFELAGYATAEDRLWQMEMSRRLARGKLAEVFGQSRVASDRDQLKTSYTTAELETQLHRMSFQAQAAFSAYAKGVNQCIADRKAAGTLPPEYAANKFSPAPWTEVDSVAIAVQMFRQFGRGGAGEIRNLALLQYLATSPAKGKELDVLDDFIWFNDPKAITTIQKEDEGVNGAKYFPIRKRENTTAQLTSIPKPGLFELMPGLRLLEEPATMEASIELGVPYKMGSYAIVVGKSRSRTNKPLLLGAPQMGFTMPSIIHEMSIEAPGLRVAGMDVPGIPGIIIGHTDRFAWTITSGIADTDDVFAYPIEGGKYKFGDELRQFDVVEHKIPVAGGETITVQQKRTNWGPVVIESNSTKSVFALRSSYWMQEMKGYEAMFDLASAQNPDDAEKAVAQSPMTFNFFYAFNTGEIGYRYVGSVPIRNTKLDPRFPAIANSANDWQGMIPADKMPRVRNPKSGLIFNWNNKPISWWPNMDTPLWGLAFRNRALADLLNQKQFDRIDLERTSMMLARTEPTFSLFEPWIMALKSAPGWTSTETEALTYLQTFGGRKWDDSAGAAIYFAWMNELRDALFMASVGNMISPDLFRQATQPEIILSALNGTAKINYRGQRGAEEIVSAAFRRAVAQLSKDLGPNPGFWRHINGGIAYPGEATVPYRERGTLVQIIELNDKIVGRNVVAPGVAETGPHSKDQLPLLRSWKFKPMRFAP